MRQPALDRYRGRELNPGAELTTDAPARRFRTGARRDGASIRRARARWAMTTWRWSTTRAACMALESLRVVDASIMPQITTGNLNAPTIRLAGEDPPDRISRTRSALARGGYAYAVANGAKARKREFANDMRGERGRRPHGAPMREQDAACRRSRLDGFSRRASRVPARVFGAQYPDRRGCNRGTSRQAKDCAALAKGRQHHAHHVRPDERAHAADGRRDPRTRSARAGAVEFGRRACRARPHREEEELHRETGANPGRGRFRVRRSLSMRTP